MARAFRGRSCTTRLSISRISKQRDLNQSGPDHHSSRQRGRPSTRTCLRSDYPGPLISTGDLPEPGTQRELLRESRSSLQRHGSVQRPLQPLSRRKHQLARRRRIERAQRVRQPVRHRSDDRRQQHLTLSPRMVNETRAQFTNSNLPPRLPTRSGRPSVSPAWLPSARSPDRRPARLNKLGEVTTTSVQHRRARHPRRASTFCITTTPSPFRAPIAAAIRFPRSPISCPGRTTAPASPRRSPTAWCHQTNPNVGFYAQDEWNVSPRFTLNLGVRYDLEFLRTIATANRQRLAARRLCLDAVRFAQDGDSRQLRPLLRPHPAAPARQCSALRE